MQFENFISCAIVTYNNGEKAANICKQLVNYTKKYPLKFYVIDNASTDDTVERISKIQGITIIQNKKNLGFGAAHNMPIKEGIGKYHFVINPDIEINGDILSDMADFLEENSDIVMAMPNILNPDKTVQYLPKKRPTFKRLYLGRFFKKYRDEYVMANTNFESVTDIDFCTGCFFGIKGSVFENLGGFDKRYFMYMEDVDLTLMAKKYGRVVIAPQFSVVHLWERESAKSLKYLFIHINSSLKFLRKWRKNANENFGNRL